jgi:hypothetical protein
MRRSTDATIDSHAGRRQGQHVARRRMSLDLAPAATTGGAPDKDEMLRSADHLPVAVHGRILSRPALRPSGPLGELAPVLHGLGRELYH